MQISKKFLFCPNSKFNIGKVTKFPVEKLSTSDVISQKPHGGWKTTPLPAPLELNDKHISDTQYVHAIKVWKTFKLKYMGEYHDLHLKSDVHILADVFENFRKTCMQYYKLDQWHYFKSPGLSWDAMFKMTDIDLELIINVDMCQFIEKSQCVVEYLT